MQRDLSSAFVRPFYEPFFLPHPLWSRSYEDLVLYLNIEILQHMKFYWSGTGCGGAVPIRDLLGRYIIKAEDICTFQ